MEMKFRTGISPKHVIIKPQLMFQKTANQVFIALWRLWFQFRWF